MTVYVFNTILDNTCKVDFSNSIRNSRFYFIYHIVSSDKINLRIEELLYNR